MEDILTDYNLLLWGSSRNKDMAEETADSVPSAAVFSMLLTIDRDARVSPH